LSSDSDDDDDADDDDFVVLCDSYGMQWLADCTVAIMITQLVSLLSVCTPDTGLSLLFYCLHYIYWRKLSHFICQFLFNWIFSLN